jgi:hypothetical protein
MRKLAIAAALILFLAGCGSESENRQEPGGGADTGPATTQQSDPYDY